MELIPPTADALARLERLGATEVHAGLESIARLPELIAPQCVGLSMGLVEDGLTFTLAASDLQTVGLDAIQYLDRGPCVDAVHGVQSSLSMPLVDGDRVVGGVNLSFSSRLHAARLRRSSRSRPMSTWSPDTSPPARPSTRRPPSCGCAKPRNEPGPPR